MESSDLIPSIKISPGEEFRLQIEGAFLLSDCAPFHAVNLTLKEAAKFAVTEFGSDGQEVFMALATRAWDEAIYEMGKKK